MHQVHRLFQGHGRRGQNGSQNCVDRVTYIDGEEVSREAVSRTTTQEPVNKQIVVGTKKRPTYSGSGQSSGSLMWPVPYTTISSNPITPITTH